MKRMQWLRTALSAMLGLAMLATAFGCQAKETTTDEAKPVVLEETFGSEQYGIGFRNGDIALGLKIQEGMDAIMENGTAAAISTTWFGEDKLLSDQPYLEESEAAADDDSWTKVQEKGYFIVGLDATFPPMGYLDENNEFVGFDIDLAKAVAKELGVEVRFQSINWDAKDMELNNGNIDCIWNGMTINESRLESMYFTKAYLSNEQIVITLSNSGISKKSDLAGKVVASQAESSGLEAMEGESALYASMKEVPLYDSYLDAYNDLLIGRVDALVIDSTMGYYIMAQN